MTQVGEAMKKRLCLFFTLFIGIKINIVFIQSRVDGSRKPEIELSLI